jgi:thiamine-phosphate pyrophosphorylase
MIRQLWPECKLLGYSADLPAHLHNEFASASDYIAISPVFKTATKEDTINEWGIEGLREARKWTQKPLVAIGGIHPQEVIPILETGVQSICVVSEIAAKSSPRTAAANLKQLITNYYESI